MAEGLESIGDVVQRVVARNAAKWQRKNPSEQTIQQIDDLAALLLPGFVCRMNAGQPHYPAGSPPMPEDAARATIQDAHSKGAANTLEDEAIAAVVAQRLIAHWKGMIEQRDSESRKPRAKLRDAWPGVGR